MNTETAGRWILISERLPPENTWVLTFADWDAQPPVGVSRYTVVIEIEQVIEHESLNTKGRRRVIQEISKPRREWDGRHWEPSHWMPLPPSPNEPKGN